MNQKQIRVIHETNTMFFSIPDAVIDADSLNSYVWSKYYSDSEELTVIIDTGCKSELRGIVMTL